MICFSDTDITLKLIQFRLMAQALAALGVTSDREVYVTPEAAAKCRISRREGANFRRETLNEALNYLRRFSVISTAGDLDEWELLLDVGEDMDVGEATLFLATRDVPDFVLLTGDKRALRSLTNNFRAQELHNRHLGRVVCLESLILLIIRREGFRAVHPKLLAEQICDKAIQNALQRGQATESEFIEALERYIERLEAETQGLLKKF